MKFVQHLKITLASNIPLIYIITNEEQRLESYISNITKKFFPCSVYSWNFIDGYYNNPNYAQKAQKNPIEALEIIENIDSNTNKIFLLKDFHLFINDISITRKLKNLYYILNMTNSYIIISSPELKIPFLLKEYTKILYLPLPNKEEIKDELYRINEMIHILQNHEIDILASAYKGFSVNQIRRSIGEILVTSKPIQHIYNLVAEEKKQLIKQTDILEFYPSCNKLEDIGGLKNLKIWLKKRNHSFSNQAKTYGIPNPKGILLVGIQGTGKSLSAKAIAKEWNLPLLKLDIGKIFAGVVGESESRMRSMIQLTEQSAPCILWIDELDKAFKNNYQNNDSGTTSRVLSELLTWLSEKTSPIFIVATANSISDLPPEILRKGRFDEIFFLNLPNIKERQYIFNIHLKKVRPLTWHKYDTLYLSQITKQFSGAEIEQSIVDAMHNAFYEEREFTTIDIIRTIEYCVPLAFTDQYNIDQLQQWVSQGKLRIA
uniref:Uncharacterized AAA domain-containing protein ycf46 n=1 Tax=Callithamnion tetricum TaxID=193179 RepID=A0A4D6WRG7_9FLOR|nr:hypothetical protein [Callithamnion tetricum]